MKTINLKDFDLRLDPYPASIAPRFKVTVGFTHDGSTEGYTQALTQDLTIREDGDEDLARYERPRPRNRSGIRAQDVRACVEEILADIRDHHGLTGVVVESVEIRSEALVAWTYESQKQKREQGAS